MSQQPPERPPEGWQPPQQTQPLPGWGQQPPQQGQPPQWGPPGQQPYPGWAPPPQPPAPKRSKRNRNIALAILGVLVLFGVIGALSEPQQSSSVSTSRDKAAGESTSENTISKGLGTKDASKDVRLVSFREKDFGEAEAVFEITNHSSGTSDYYIEVVFEDASGTNIDWSNAVAESVRPGQKARTTSSTFDEAAKRVVITEVQRTSSG